MDKFVFFFLLLILTLYKYCRVFAGPIRQGGLSPIPNEVYMEIFKYLRPPDNNLWIDPVYRRDFSRVALVCRFFCSVMLPWIFESIAFEGNTNGSLDLNHAAFCRNIIRGCGSARTMATYVKRCLFLDWILDQNDSTQSWYKKEFQALYSRALAFMPNVEELKLERTHINKYLLKSIMELKSLTTLSLDYCLIGEVKAKSIRKLSTLQLKHLRFVVLGGIVSGDGHMLITSRSLCLDSLLTLHTNCWHFGERIAKQNCHLPLQVLEIFGVKDVELLPRIFQNTPALERLRIGLDNFTETPKYDVQFGNVLPALHELCCPLSLLRSLVPGRPISSIEITDESLKEITDIQSFFKKSTCKILSLCVPVRFYLTIPFWEHFPDLKALRLKYVPNYLLSFDERFLEKVFANIIFASKQLPIIHMYRVFQISLLSVTPGLTTLLQ